LAEGYADGDNSRFVTEGTTRWFVTSDLGATDDDGRLHVIGRADDVVVTGGVKVAPGPVEATLMRLPWVSEAVVVGVPDDEWGEALVGLLVVRAEAPVDHQEESRNYCAQTLDRAQIPRAIHAVDALPRLASGKVDRAAARELATRLTRAKG
jgi:O-succinylbenzoic acid--CoA ligase